MSGKKINCSFKLLKIDSYNSLAYLNMILAIVIFFVSLENVNADRIVRKSNNQLIEGTIVSENASEVRIEVKISETISDLLIIPRSDILEISKETEDEREFNKLMKEYPVPDNMSKNHYSRLIVRFKNYLKLYPLSSKKSKAQKVLKDLELENKKVRDGWKKIDGKLIPNSEYIKNRYELDSNLLLKKLSIKIKKRNYIESLKIIDKIENQYPFTNAHYKVIPKAKEILGTYRIIINSAKNNVEKSLKDLEENFKRMSYQDKIKNEKAFKVENDKFKKRRMILKDQGNKWLPYSKFDSESIDELFKTIEDEILKYEKIDKEIIYKISSKIRQAKKAAYEENVDASEKMIEDINKYLTEYNSETNDKITTFAELDEIKKINSETKIKIEKSKIKGADDDLKAGVEKVDPIDERKNEGVRAIDELQKINETKKNDSAKIDEENKMDTKINNKPQTNKNIKKLKKKNKKGSLFGKIKYPLLLVMVIVVGFLYYREKYQKV